MAEKAALSPKYANLDKKEWTKFVSVHIPNISQGEVDIGSSNYRLKCNFCQLSFTGTKSRVVDHLAGCMGKKVISTCILASPESLLWARSQRGASIRKMNSFLNLAEADVQMTSDDTVAMASTLSSVDIADGIRFGRQFKPKN